MKRYRIFAMILVLAMVFSLTACNKGAPATSPASSEPSSPASSEPSQAQTSSDGETYTLVYSYFAQDFIGPSMFIKDAAARIEERSNGRLKLELNFNGTLLSFSDTVTGCINGVADIVTFDQGAIAEVFPLSNVFSMPYLETPPDKRTMDAVYNRFIAETPELNDELAKQGLMYLGVAAIGGYHLHGTTELFDSQAKLPGKTIDGLGEGGNIITSMGGNGVAMDPGDWYLSLSTGLLDGMLAHFAMMTGFALSELLTTHVIFSNNQDLDDYYALFGGGIYSPMMGNVMNIASYEALPPDLQEILIDEMSKFAQFVTDMDIPDMVTPAVNVCVERGDTFVFVGDAEREAWLPGMQEFIDKWSGQVSALGYDGKALYQKLLDMF